MSPAPDPRPGLIVGRAVFDFRRWKERIPPGSVIRPCVVCSESTAVSPEAVQLMRDAQTAFTVMCSRCAFKSMSKEERAEKVLEALAISPITGRTAKKP